MPTTRRSDRPANLRLLPDADFARLKGNNPYSGEVYEHPDLLVPHSDLGLFHETLARRNAERLPLVAEIGCGSGAYLLEHALREPARFHVAFELRFKRLCQAARKLSRHDIPNALLVRDRGEYLREYFGLAGLAGLHVNFPDPWAKTPQLKHRLIQPAFLDELSRVLAPGGVLSFKTDHAEYFRTATGLVRMHPAFELENHAADLHKSPFHESNIETEFEKLFKSKHNPPIGYLTARMAGPVTPDGA